MGINSSYPILCVSISLPGIAMSHFFNHARASSEDIGWVCTGRLLDAELPPSKEEIMNGVADEIESKVNELFKRDGHVRLSLFSCLTRYPEPTVEKVLNKLGFKESSKKGEFVKKSDNE